MDPGVFGLSVVFNYIIGHGCVFEMFLGLGRCHIRQQLMPGFLIDGSRGHICQ